MKVKLVFPVAFLMLVSCSSSSVSERKDRANPAAYDAALFVVEREMPVRAPSNQEFFYKRCTLNNNKVFVDKAEYDCN